MRSHVRVEMGFRRSRRAPPKHLHIETLQRRSRSRRPMFGLVFPFLSKTDVNAHAAITRVLIALASTTSLCSHTLGQY